MKRVAIRKFKDLLPEVLIVAQGCDEITALAALRRTVEYLCTQYRFFHTERIYSLEGKDSSRMIRVPLGIADVVAVNSVVACDDEDEDKHDVLWNYGIQRKRKQLYLEVARHQLPEDLSTATLYVDMDIMPSPDDDIGDIENFTKWRTCIVYGALADLLSMQKQSWADSTKFAIYSERYRRVVEDFLYSERVDQVDSRRFSVALGERTNTFS